MKRKKMSPSRRHRLAIRDKSAWLLFTPRGRMWLYRCAVCRRPLQTAGLTVGHVIPLSEGGTNEDDNLRVECHPCNLLDNIRRCLKDQPRAVERTARALSRDRMRWLARTGTSRLFDNQPVYFEGRLISYTSDKRAGLTKNSRQEERLAHGGIRLLRPPRSRAPGRTLPVKNQCIRCGVSIGLRAFAIHPIGSAAQRRLRKSDNTLPVCRECRGLYEIGYAMEITRIARSDVLPYWHEYRSDRERKALALEAWSRKKSRFTLPSSLTKRFQVAFGVDPETYPLDGLGNIADLAGRELKASERNMEAMVLQAMTGIDFPRVSREIGQKTWDPWKVDPPGIPPAELGEE